MTLRPPPPLLRAGLVLVAMAVLLPNALADTVLVPTVKLTQTASRSYVLETVVSSRVTGLIRLPVLPEGCGPSSDPSFSRDGNTVTWRFAFECTEPLGRTDALYLPWQVDGIRMATSWENGAGPERLFGREGAGIVIPLAVIMIHSESPIALAARYVPAGLRHFMTGWGHLLLILAIAVCQSRRRVVLLLAGFTGGHALSLIVAELGAVGVPAVPAEASLAVGAALVLARMTRWDEYPNELALAGAFLGLTHGLGTATHLAADGVIGFQLVPALFLNNLGVDLAQWILGFGIASVLATLARRQLHPRGAVVYSLGVLSAFFVFAIMRHGLANAVVEPEAGAGTIAATSASGQTAGTSVALRGQTTGTGQLAFPFLSYLTVEPYQVRHEILVSVQSLREWVSVPLDGDMIPIDVQQGLKERTIELLASENQLIVDGASTRPATTRADFVTIGEAGVLTREDAEPESLATAVIGVVLEYATEGLPDRVTIEWGLFSDRAQPVPVLVTDPVAEAEYAATPATSSVTWQNTLGDYALPTVEAIQATKPRIPMVSLVFVPLAAVLLVSGKRSVRRPIRFRSAWVLLGVAYVAYPFSRVSAEIPFVAESRIRADDAGSVLEALLTNVYRSFDIHDEEAIYDRLALTVTGEQLVDVYLESRRALELESRGGALVRTDEVVVRDVRSVRRTTDGGFELDAVWTVGGSVNHFGHEHFRQNSYDAFITVVPSGDTWKIAGVELIEERRVL